MLIFTGRGHFLSVVEDMNDPEMVFVRSQDRESVQRVITVLEGQIPVPDKRVTYELIDEPDWDYQFRVHLTKSLFQVYLIDTVYDIDYHKVKPTVAEARGYEHPISRMVEEIFYRMSENRPDGSLPAWLGGRTWADGLADWDKASEPVDEFKSDIDRVTRAAEQALEDTMSRPELAASLGLDADELQRVLEQQKEQRSRRA